MFGTAVLRVRKDKHMKGTRMAGDVVSLILEDHQRFESLLRDLRKEGTDRLGLRSELANLLVAHAEAEEHKVYPHLKRRATIDDETADHEQHEHAEGHEALLALLEIDETDSGQFGEAVEELTKELAHHMDEEERKILNPARNDVPEETRRTLGHDFIAERQKLLDTECGAIENVRRLVKEARSEDLI